MYHIVEHSTKSHTHAHMSTHTHTHTHVNDANGLKYAHIIYWALIHALDTHTHTQHIFMCLSSYDKFIQNPTGTIKHLSCLWTDSLAMKWIQQWYAYLYQQQYFCAMANYPEHVPSNHERQHYNQLDTHTKKKIAFLFQSILYIKQKETHTHTLQLTFF